VHTSFANAPTFATCPGVAGTSITSAGTSIASTSIASACVTGARVTRTRISGACVARTRISDTRVACCCVAGAYVGTDVNRADIDGLTYLELHAGNVLLPINV
jgi:hypothetical protein